MDLASLDMDVDMSSASFTADRASRGPPAFVETRRLMNNQSQNKTIYNNLDERRKELRLLTILPQTENSEFVCCSLGTFSLQDVYPEYTDFLDWSSNQSLSWNHDGFLGDKTVPEIIEMNIKDQWTSKRLSPQLAVLEPLKRINSTKPSSRLHRFVWGDFAAISYTWGDKNDTRDILLNGHRIPVTANLEAALRDFRSACEFNGRFKLWVDAVCINQQDLNERASQVKMMREIYETAWSVVAWLGEEGCQSSSAIQLIKDFVALKEANCIEMIEKCLRADPHFYGSGHWMALERLMNRPYWYRLWIFQEIIMGGTSTWIRCGNTMIEWKIFCTGIGVLQEHLWLAKDRCLDLDLVTAGVAQRHSWRTTSQHLVYQDLSVLGQTLSKSGKEFDFERLLDLANSGDCTDKRDKVYALLGLMSPSITRHLHTDYTLPEWKVYTEVARAFIQEYDNLDPLREGNPWGPTRGPSWAADWLWPGRLRWTRTDQQIWGPEYLFKRNPACKHDTPYRASEGRKQESMFSNDGLLLSCTGFIVDSICGLSARNVAYFSWSRESIVRPQRWKSRYGDHHATAEALCRTLIADRVAYGGRTEARHAAIFQLPSTFERAGPQFKERGWSFLAGQEGYYFRWQGFRAANRDFPLGECLFDHFFSDEIPAEASEYDVTEVYSCFDRSSKKRRFMTTTSGYIGWAPDNIYGNDDEQTRPGDLIAIVFGCSTPLVLRPHGAYFKVLGEAYVQGLMDGEGIQAVEKGEYQTRRLVIC